jgi:formate hydrogenlyase subunit 3/multisubunit Na+/H+ antiporter MnhD subunit
MDSIRLRLSSSYYLPALAYFLIAVACFAKAGAMPFHSWIPPCAKDAPIPVAAYLPASLDKLLGIYLLARISLNIFEMNAAMSVFLMCIGAVTVLAAVMMALVQHDMKKLLGYHAVSQVGYMVLGIASGNPVGIAGGIFHMINHAVYKSCLFLTAGNVEYRTKTTQLDELGGLSRLMPVTYITCLIASLSISGVPPFNGFVSKWMIYQGLIQRLSLGGADRLLVALCLVVALFGSGLTLASFMKLIHSVFLGQRNNQERKPVVGEVSAAMWLPCVILAAICVVFGVFANQIPLKYFVFPAVPGVEFSGVWYAGLSTALVILALLFGLFIFHFNFFRPRMRQDKVFTGGEPLDFASNAVTGTEFYNTIREYGVLKGIYMLAEKGTFDIYEQAKKLAVLSKPLRYLHNGVLPTYLVWMLLGMLGLLIWNFI